MTVDQPDQAIAFAAPDITDAEIAAVVRVLERGWITTGEECFALEGELASYLDVQHVVAMASCTAALETAIAYLGVPPGSRVGVPTWTFVSSALAAVRNGCVPVLLDIDPATLNVSPDAVERAAASAGLDALVAVHFGGVPLDPAVRSAAEAASIPVIEDAAHALGAHDERGLVNGQGVVGAAFSFYATKNLTSAEGGALATDDPELDAFARTFRQHGMSHDAWARYRPGAAPRYDVVIPGIKANLPDVLAALARAQLQRFPAMQRHRRELLTRYRTNLDAAGIPMVPAEPIEGSADHLAVVRLSPSVDRETVLAALQAARIGASVHFVPLHHMTWFREHAEMPDPFPSADAAAPAVLSLPLHARLTLDEVDRVCDVVNDATRR